MPILKTIDQATGKPVAEFVPECCRCGMCCLSKPCPIAVMEYGQGAAAVFGPERCRGLSFDVEGRALCALLGPDPDYAKRKAFGVNSGCCIKARAVDRFGGVHNFASLPDRVKVALAKQQVEREN